MLSLAGSQQCMPHSRICQVTRRANYRAQHLRELAWREEQQQAHIAKEMDCEVPSGG